MAGHQRKTGRTANGQLTIGSLEKNALSGKLVQVRSDRGLVAIASQSRPQIIDGNEEDIGANLGAHDCDKNNEQSEVNDTGLQLFIRKLFIDYREQWQRKQIL